jgi:hypothetical protein
MNFEEFCKKFNLRTTTDQNLNGEFFSSTHTQIAYMAFLAGQANGSKECLDYLIKNMVIDKRSYQTAIDIHVDRWLFTLNNIIQTDFNKEKQK